MRPPAATSGGAPGYALRLRPLVEPLGVSARCARVPMCRPMHPPMDDPCAQRVRRCIRRWARAPKGSVDASADGPVCPGGPPVRPKRPSRSLSLRGPRSGPKQSRNAGRACPKSRTETGRRRATSLFFAPQCHRERKALEACHCEAREAGRSNLVTRAEPVRSRALKRQRGLRPAPSRAGHSGTPDANRAGVGVLWPFLPCDAIGILVSAVMP